MQCLPQDCVGHETVDTRVLQYENCVRIGN